jgi:transcriptional antiterminator NusG
MAETVEPQLPLGQKVRIIAGPFKQFVGAVESEDAERGKVSVKLNLFFRPVKIELDREQVVKI